MIVLDDGANAPVDPEVVAAVGGRVVRLPTGPPIETKLNHGLQVATGELCQKLVDDD